MGSDIYTPGLTPGEFTYLRELLETKLNLTREITETKLKLMDKALEVANKNLDLRLDNMNGFQEQIAKQARDFLPRNEYLVQHQNIVDKYELLEKRVQAVEQLKANVQGRIWATGAMAALFIAAIQIAIHVFMGKP